MILSTKKVEEEETTTLTPEEYVPSLLDRVQVLRTFNMDQVLCTIKVSKVKIRIGIILSHVK